MSSSYYPVASYDRLASIITMSISIGLITLTLFSYYLILFSPPSSPALGITAVTFITVITTITLSVPYLFSPIGYNLTSTELIIQRPIKSILIPYNRITEIEKLKWLWKGVRLGGSGGLYGYLGLFYFFGAGKVWMYVTNKNKMLLVKCINDKQYAISPNSLDFLAEAKIKIATNRPNRDR